MNHDVFISYSEADKAKADAVCSILERNGIRCWIAPRDILPGATWGSSIVRAIQGSKVFILVFSSHSNHSPQVVREVERAVRQTIPIIPFRIEAATPTGDMEYFISAQHWLDALDPPLERHIERLASVVKKLLSEDLRPEAANAAAAKPRVAPGTERPARGPLAAGVAGTAVGAGAGTGAGAGSAPPGLPPRIEPARPGPLAATGVSHGPLGIPAKPLAIMGGVIGGVILLAAFVIAMIVIARDGEEEIDVGEIPSLPAPASDASTSLSPGSSSIFTLNAGVDHFHPFTVPPGETRTVGVLSNQFDPVLEVWLQTERIDTSSSQPETALLDGAGEWVVAVSSYSSDRAGAYTLSVADGAGTILSSGQYTISPGNRNPHALEVPLGQTWRVTAASSEFDVVLQVLQNRGRTDAAVTGVAEEVVLNEPGDWEVIVKSYNNNSFGPYTLTVR